MAIADLIRPSARFRALLNDVGPIAPVDSAVPAQGETGAGKEATARAIHEAGPRQRLVALNCAAIPSALLPREPFGHQRGAFAGACSLAAFCLGGFLLSGCGSPRPATVQFTQVPEAGPGGAARTVKIAGRATGVKPGQRIVLFARAGTWYVQPFGSRPFTEIQPDRSWSNITHVGSEYAALLVERDYAPPKVADVLPAEGGPVIAVATVSGTPSALSRRLTPGKMSFSGFEWEVYRAPRDIFGTLYPNSPSNVWTDSKGWLHLRITKEPEGWTGAEINLTRSLGYGTCSFVIHELPALEPATVLSVVTWDPLDAGQYHRSFDIMLGQFGDPAIKNAQYSILPFNVPGNVYRFTVPRGAFTHSIHWERGRLSFETKETGGRSRVVTEHAFTAGIPTPGGEKIHINLFAYADSKVPQKNGIEVIVEKFAYLP